MSPVRNQPSSVNRSSRSVDVVVLRARPTARAPRARPSSAPSHGARPFSVARADLDERQRRALLRAIAVSARRTARPASDGGRCADACRAASSRSCPTRGRRRDRAAPEGRGSSTAAPRCRRRRSRAARSDRARRAAVELLQHAEPDGRHAGGNRHPLADEQIEHARRVEVAAREAPARRRTSCAVNGRPHAFT